MSNIAVAPGGETDPKVATDEVGGVHYQVTKLAFGAPGDATPVSENDPLPVSGPLTDAELRAKPVPVTRSPDDTAALMSLLRALVHPIWEEAATGRLRVVLDPIGGTQTLGTVSTVTSLSQVAGVSAGSFIYDQMHAAWASAVRPRIV